MMKDAAVANYHGGMNCVQCILKAAEECRSLKIDKQLIEVCGILNNGFGMGLFCGALLAGFIVFELSAGENAAKRMRLRLLSDFHDKYKCFNCAELTCKSCRGGCDRLIYDTAEMIDSILFN